MRSFFAFLAVRYFRFFARVALAIHRPLIIGIAGSVGKTSTKEALAVILEDSGRVLVTEGNSETGIPFAILGIPISGYSLFNWLVAALRAPFGIFHLVGAKFLVAEMGIDDPLPPKNMDYLLTILEPDVAVFVTESAAHTQQFEKVLNEKERSLPAAERRELLIERITAEDLKMAAPFRCKTIIYNSDNQYLRRGLKQVNIQGKTMRNFGSEKSASLVCAGHEVSLEASRFLFKSNSETLTVAIHHQILPKEYGEVFAAALLAAQSCGVPFANAAERLSGHFQPPKGRASVFAGINNSVIIDSSYNASRSSVLAFLDLVFQLKEKTERPVVFAFGDMRELGSEAEIEHIAVAERIPGVVDYVYCVGELTKKYILPRVQNAILQDVRWFQNSKELGVYLREHMPEGALVLVKGSQNTIFLEEAIKFFLANKEDEKKLCRQEGYWVKT